MAPEQKRSDDTDNKSEQVWCWVTVRGCESEVTVNVERFFLARGKTVGCQERAGWRRAEVHGCVNAFIASAGASLPTVVLTKKKSGILILLHDNNTAQWMVKATSLLIH